jgi:hypothetical protein
MKDVREQELIGRIRNNVRTLLHTHLDRAQRRLLQDVGAQLDLLKVEVMKRETLATEETENAN